MNKLKKPLLIIVVLLLLIFAIPVIVLFAVDVDYYKQELEQLVRQQTGRELKIDGSINKSIIPWFGITINDLKLGNPEGFEEKDFVSIGKFSLKVKFWTLFSGRVDIDSVQLDKLDLRLLLIPGKNNWTFSTASSDEPASDSHATQAEIDANKDENKTDVATDAAIEEAKGFSTDDFSLAGVIIVKANISFEDRINNQKFAANDINLNLSQFAFGKPAKLKLSLKATSQEPPMDAEIKLDSLININPDKKRYGGEIKKLGLVINSSLVGKQPLKVTLNSQAEFDAAKGLLRVPALNIENEELKLNFSAEQIQSNPPGFKGGLSIAEMNLRSYLTRLGVALPDTLSKQALQRFSLNTRYLLDLDHASLREVKIKLDNSELSGAISHLQFSPLGAHWKLALNQFNLDEYIPPPPPPAAEDKNAKDKKAAPKAAPTSTLPASSGNEPILPLALLDTLDLDGSLSIKKLQARNVVLEQTDLVVKSDETGSDAKLSIKSIGSGSLQADIKMLPAKTEPKIQSRIVMNKVSAGDILQKLLNSDVVSGANVDFNSQLSTNGNSINTWKRGLNGKVNLELKDGHVNGVNVMAGLIEKYEKYVKRDFPKSEIENRTAFDQVSANLIASNGVFTSAKLIAKAPEFSADGKVKVDLPAETLDLAMDIKGEKFPRWIAEADAKNLASVKFPFTLKGPFDNLKPDYDVAGPLKDLAKNLVKQQVQKKAEEKKAEVKEKVKQKAQDAIKDRLKKFF